MEVDVKSSDPAILELMAEENALTTAYEKLYASALIEFDGRKKYRQPDEPLQAKPGPSRAQSRLRSRGSMV